MTARNRKQSIDMLRFVAAFGIVWAHMQAPFMIIGYLALPLFVILIAFLSLRSLVRGGERRFWQGRLLRFFLPWLVWSFAYLLLDVLRGNDLPQVLHLEDPWWLLIGPVVHLWFLPFVVIFSPLVVLAAAVLTSAGRLWLAALLCLPVALVAIWLHDGGALPEPLLQWAFALTPLLYGLLSASARHYEVTTAPLLFITLAGGIATLAWGSPIGPFLIVAALLFEGLWRIDLKGQIWTELGRLAFGIYLVHPVAMLVWYRFAGAEWSQAMGALAVFALSALLTALIRCTGVGRILT